MSDKEKNVTITIPENRCVVLWWIIASIISLGCIVSCGFLIFKNTDKIGECSFLILALVLIVLVTTINYISWLEYKEKIFRSTLSTAKVIMALEKQKEHSSVQSAKIDKITLDGKALISIDWPKDINQNNSNQSAEQNGE